MKVLDNNFSVMNRDVGIMIGIFQFADHVSLNEMDDIWMFVLKETSQRGKSEVEDVIVKDGLDVVVHACLGLKTLDHFLFFPLFFLFIDDKYHHSNFY